MARKKKKIFVYYYLIILTIILAVIIFNSNGLFNYYQLRNELEDTRLEIQKTEERNQKLDKVNDSLRTSDIKIEEVARERYNMKNKNEEVLKISGEDE